MKIEPVGSSLMRFPKVGATSAPPSHNPPFGAWVRCMALPGKPEFVGIITFQGRNAYGETFFHVRDEHGQYAYRTIREFTVLEENQLARSRRLAKRAKARAASVGAPPVLEEKPK